MIVFLVSASHTYTLNAVKAAATDFRVDTMSYADFFAAKAPPRATYIFSDLDRLAMWELRVSASMYRQLRDQGVRVLNDPARVASRHGLLRQLHRAGINRFNAYRVEEGVRPTQWPVFLRAEGDHLGPISRLLQNATELQSAVAEAIGVGCPLPSLLIVEYAAQPVRPGLFRRLSIYQIGPTSVADTCVHEADWRAKIGKDGTAPADLYEDELRIVRDNPYRETVGKAFAIGGIDYGRADFGLVDGTVQVYEINTNPNVELLGDSPSPFRSESRRLSNANYLAALRQIDTPDNDSILKPFDPRQVPRS